MNIHAIFPVPFLAHVVDKEIADKVEKVFDEKVFSMPLSDDQYTDFFVPFKTIDINKDVPELRDEILKARDKFVEETGIECERDRLQYWTQDYRDEGQRHGSHCHGIFGVSGVYWIRANENAGDFRFTNPNILNQYTRYDKDTWYSAIHQNIKPEKGALILFPSYVFHEVLPSGKNAVRSTLAFNFPFAPYQPGINIT